MRRECAPAKNRLHTLDSHSGRPPKPKTLSRTTTRDHNIKTDSKK